MTLEQLGFTSEITAYLEENNLSGFSVGRVTREHRERYIVSTGDNEYEAEITGNLRFTAASRSDFPAVGDWVTMTLYEPGMAIIHKILPRKSTLERQAVGKFGEIQIISANIDVALIMQSVGNNFSVNRLERYLTLCHSSGIQPVLVISKTDLAEKGEVESAIKELESRDKKVRYILLSNVTGQGLDQVHGLMQKGKTYCVVGSSGVGKSTLINNLLKENILRTEPVSRSTGKGRHTTGHRELFVLENGGIIIDTPGMREIGLTDSPDGIAAVFTDIYNLSLQCRFPGCRHIDEDGCAIIEALESGTIDIESFNNFQRLQKEQERFQVTVAEKHKKDRIFGKMIKNYYKDLKRNKLGE